MAGAGQQRKCFLNVHHLSPDRNDRVKPCNQKNPVEYMSYTTGFLITSRVWSMFEPSRLAIVGEVP